MTIRGLTVPKPASAPTGNFDGIEANNSTAWPWRELIVQKLAQGLNARRIYQDLSSPEHGYGGSYYSVRQLVAKLTGGHELPVRRMECDPGEKAQVDFGKGAPWAHPRPSRCVREFGPAGS